MSSQQRDQQLAIAIAKASSPSDRLVLQEWITQLLILKDSPLGRLEKAKKAIALTSSSKAAVTAAKLIAKHIKSFAWDERSTASKFGLSGVALGIVAFGSQGAGVAALGTAIGVPLWVISGAGASMAGVLLEELKRQSS